MRVLLRLVLRLILRLQLRLRLCRRLRLRLRPLRRGVLRSLLRMPPRSWLPSRPWHLPLARRRAVGRRLPSQPCRPGRAGGDDERWVLARALVSVVVVPRSPWPLARRLPLLVPMLAIGGWRAVRACRVVPAQRPCHVVAGGSVAVRSMHLTVVLAMGDLPCPRGRQHGWRCHRRQRGGASLGVGAPLSVTEV